MPDSPFACDLRALDPTQRERHHELLKVLASAFRGHRELADGYSFRLADDDRVFVQAAEWVTLERRCCPFLRLALKRDTEGTWLDVAGGPGVKMFIAAEFAGVLG
jgi:hypothetical protein